MAVARSSARPMLKGSALALAVLCTGLTWAVFDPAAMTDLAHAGRDGVDNALRQIDVAWDRIDADDSWVPSLSGAFQPTDAAASQATGVVTLDGAIVRSERGLELRTEPARIAFGHQAMDADRSWSEALDVPPSAQIELRRARALAPDARDRLTPPPETSLCADQRPGVVALWTGRGQMVMAIWPEGVSPGAQTPVEAACGVWRYRR